MLEYIPCCKLYLLRVHTPTNADIVLHCSFQLAVQHLAAQLPIDSNTANRYSLLLRLMINDNIDARTTQAPLSYRLSLVTDEMQIKQCAKQEH